MVSGASQLGAKYSGFDLEAKNVSNLQQHREEHSATERRTSCKRAEPSAPERRTSCSNGDEKLQQQ